MDRWLFFLKNSENLKNYSDAFQSEVFRRVLEVLEISSFTQEEFNMYYSEEEQKKIREAQDATIRRLGKEEGRAEGRAEEKRENARKMLAKGMSVSDIAEITGLAVEDIEGL